MIHWPRMPEAEPNGDGNGHRPLALLDRAVAPLRRPQLHRPAWRPEPCREPVTVAAPEAARPEELRPGSELAVVRSVRIGSVARVALCFALTGFIALLSAVSFLWLLATGSGEMARFEDLLHSIGFTGVRIEFGAIIAGTALVGLAGVLLVVVLAVLTAVIYNGVGRSIGGIRVEIVRPGAEPQPPEWITPVQRAG